jgi:hypothetical protein
MAKREKKRDIKRNFPKSYEQNKMKHHRCRPACGGVYFIGFIGAVIYYIQQSTTFWQGVIGVLKALVWPAFLVYKFLGK